MGNMFADGKSSHSLRRGGALFYSCNGASRESTQQQGGWRTSQVMSQVYTNLTSEEVEAELALVASKAASSVVLRGFISAVGIDKHAAVVASKSAAFALLSSVRSNMPHINTPILQATGVGKVVKYLTRHSDQDVRSWVQSCTLYSIHNGW